MLCLDRAGLVGEDGATHHGAFDLAYLRPIPNLTIASPMNEHELRHLMYTAQLPDKGPFVIRYPRGRGKLVDWKCPMQEIPVGTGRKLKAGHDLAILTIGPIGYDAETAIIRAEKKAKEQKKEISIAHYDMRFLKPIDTTLLQEIGSQFDRIITIEDGVLTGGLGSAVVEYMNEHGFKPQIVRMGLPDSFVEHGTVKELYQICGIDEDSILSQICSCCHIE